MNIALQVAAIAKTMASSATTMAVGEEITAVMAVEEETTAMAEEITVAAAGEETTGTLKSVINNSIIFNCPAL